jgi:hypothetical protein
MAASRRERWLRNILYGLLTFLLGTYLAARYIVDGVFEPKLTGVLCVMVIAWSLTIWLARRSR